jgi:hypothetical protein
MAGKEEIALFLLASGANPHLHSEFDALTPIQAAQQAGLVALVAQLVQRGAVAPAPAVSKTPRTWFSRLRARMAF